MAVGIVVLRLRLQVGNNFVVPDILVDVVGAGVMFVEVPVGNVVLFD